LTAATFVLYATMLFLYAACRLAHCFFQAFTAVALSAKADSVSATVSVKSVASESNSDASLSAAFA